MLGVDSAGPPILGSAVSVWRKGVFDVADENQPE
jgi:hypothetical protein